MNTSIRRFTLLIALLFGFAATSQAVIVYNATPSSAGTLTTESGVASYLQQVTLNGPDTTYTITAMTIGINFNAIGNGQQDAFLDFYTGLNLSPSATDAGLGRRSLPGRELVSMIRARRDPTRLRLRSPLRSPSHPTPSALCFPCLIIHPSPTRPKSVRFFGWVASLRSEAIPGLPGMRPTRAGGFPGRSRRSSAMPLQPITI